MAVALAGAAGACSAGGNGVQFGSTRGSSGTGAGNGTGTGTGGGSDSSSSGISLGGSLNTGTGTGNGSANGGSCAASPYQAQQLPLDMYVMQDQSGSMSDTTSTGVSKWDAVTGAFNAFVAQPGLAGISMGLQYFALAPGGGAQCSTFFCTQNSDCGSAACGPCSGGLCTGALNSSGSDSCTSSDYGTPEVPIGALPGVGAAITASLGNHMPSTGTPTGPALQGAVDYAKTWATAHPGHVVVAVLATDGQPNECSPTDQAGLAAIAAAGLSGAPSVKTFTIGVFAQADIATGQPLLDAIAAAGGTTKAFVIDTTQNVNQQFLAALNAIRGMALGCQYSIPKPSMGQPDFNAVNVQYTPGGGGAPENFLQYPDQAHCPASGDGWYYDNNSAPTQIELCPNTCTTVSADSSGKIEILLGCQTQKGPT